VDDISSVPLPENFKASEFLANVAQNESSKEFMLEFLKIVETFYGAMERKERHLHVAVARLMESINYLFNKKYFCRNIDKLLGMNSRNIQLKL